MIKIFLTGPPGVGKTTCVMKLYENLIKNNYKVDGFVSKELREGGIRVGFELIRLSNGKRELLAHKSQVNGPKIGRYNVNLEGFEKFIAEIMDDLEGNYDVYIVDEIGPMEMLSTKFKKYVDTLLSSDKPAIFTIHINMARELRKLFRTDKPNVLYKITKENREAMPFIIWRDIKRYI